MYPSVPSGGGGRARGGTGAQGETFDPSAGVAVHDPYASQRYVPHSPQPHPPAAARAQQPAQPPQPSHATSVDSDSMQRVTLLPSEDGGEIDEALLQVSLDGVAFLDPCGSNRVKRSIPLDELAQWDATEPTAITFTHRRNGTDSSLPITAQQSQIHAIAESLCLHCLQLCDMRGVHPGELASMKTHGVVSNPLAPPAQPSEHGNEKRPRSRASVNDPSNVSLSDADYSGWLYKRGEHTSLWRRRWFVLKGKTLYWFKDPDATADAEARGYLRLLEAGAAKGNKSRQLEVFGTEAAKAGCNLLYADSDKECNQWVQALRHAAQGKPSTPSNSSKHSTSPDKKGIASELQQGLEQINRQNRRTARPSAPSAPPNRPPSMPYHGSQAPSAPAPPPPRAPQQHAAYPSGDWRVAHAPDGRPYYYNVRTNRVQWERPFM